MKKSSSPTTTQKSKSASKKVVAKKAAAKKMVVKPPKTKVATASKTTAQKSARSKKRSLVQASDGHSFWVSDGQILNDLVSLANSFKSMDTLIYHYHVQSTQNDFADWVELVLGDAACAAALRRARTPKTAHAVVVKHLNYYNL